ncbi:MAG: transpeptidase family protein [Flavobacteriales bacterium]|nr:transpeptidase family protein [Flavobacteriales bacterium]
MSHEKQIKNRVYMAYGLMVVFALAIVGRIAQIQFWEKDKWIAKAETQTTKFREIEAARGNIFAADGSLLATSKPIYEVRWDANVPSISDEYFNDHIDQLSKQLAELFKDKSASTYKRELTQARINGSQYHLIKRNVDHKDLKKLREFAIFDRGRYKGGLIYHQKNKRAKPFKQLAARTIGYDQPGFSVGLEGAYSEELAGVSGKRLMQKIAGGNWKPLNDVNEIEPEDGSDIITAIDINIQDVAEHALLTQLEKHGAHHGCAVLMEVQTGEIKAIANLTQQENGGYAETYNYAIGSATEPGSTFKLASLICLLEDGYVDITDTVDIEGGIKKYYNATMKDSKTGVYDKITVAKAFEISSNVGVSKLVNQYYGNKPEKMVDRLKKMGLDQPLGLQIKGEGQPAIKSPTDPTWSGITLPWMSIGYEVLQTPLQILAFYNAIANDGVMVQPRIVNAIKKHGKIEKEYPTTVLNDQVCSKETIAKVKKLMEGVVEHGTASNLRHANYKIAGKTGTAQIAKGGSYHTNKSYQASFVGYFPADKPRYSCIVVVDSPTSYVYYGNLVAGPIFKEISDKVYSTQIKMLEEVETDTSHTEKLVPYAKATSKEDLTKTLAELHIKAEVEDPDAQWAVAKTEKSSISLEAQEVIENLVPRVVGMGAMDALYLLENQGLKVKMIGSGVVRQQSIIPGTRATRGREIVIRLS